MEKGTGRKSYNVRLDIKPIEDGKARLKRVNGLIRVKDSDAINQMVREYNRLAQDEENRILLERMAAGRHKIGTLLDEAVAGVGRGCCGK